MVLDLETENIASYGRNVSNPFDARSKIIAAAVKFKNETSTCSHYGSRDIHAWLDRQFHKATNMLRRGHRVGLVGHNLQFDLSFIWKRPYLEAFFDAGGEILDTMVAEHMIRGHLAPYKSLRDVAVKMYKQSARTKNIEHYFSEGYYTSEIPKDELIYDVEQDVLDTEYILQRQQPLLKKWGIRPLYDLVIECLLGLVECEYNGMYVDQDALARVSEEFEQAIADTPERVNRSAKQVCPNVPDIAINSGEQVSKLLFGGWWKSKRRAFTGDYFKNGRPKYKTKIESHYIAGLGLTPDPKRATSKEGIYSTDKSHLAQIQSKDLGELERQIVDDIANYKLYHKVLSTYVRPIQSTYLYPDSKIRGCFNLVGPVTSRLSSDTPNLQNLPKHGVVADTFRTLFTSRWETGYLIEADYASVELCVAGVVSQDERFCQLIRDGVDLHRYVVSKLQDKPIDSVSKKERQVAKAANFGILYGCGPKRLSENSGASVEYCADFINLFYELFPSIKSWQDDQAKLASRNAVYTNSFTELGARQQRTWVPSLLGRIFCYVSDDAPEFLRKKGYKTTFTPTKTKNYPIQGTASDFNKIATGLLWRRLKGKPDIKLINNIHDSNLLDVKDWDALQYYLPIVKSILEEVPQHIKNHIGVDIGLPIVAELEYGDNWSQLVEAE